MAGYKPQRKNTGSGIVGLADVTIGTGKREGKVKIQFDADPKEKYYVVDIKECPRYIMDGSWVVSLSGKHDKVYYCHPYNGQFVGKVKEFRAEKDKLPKPQTFTYTLENGQPVTYEAFTVILIITQGKCKGMTSPYKLRYHFTEADDGSVAITKLRSKYTPQLERFLDVSGAWEQGALQYKDNNLPKFQERILRADKEFRIEYMNGWVDALRPLSNLVEEPDPDELDTAEELADPNDMPELEWEEEK